VAQTEPQDARRRIAIRVPSVAGVRHLWRVSRWVLEPWGFNRVSVRADAEPGSDLKVRTIPTISGIEWGFGGKKSGDFAVLKQLRLAGCGPWYNYR
jgi:hypothetical protein